MSRSDRISSIWVPMLAGLGAEADPAELTAALLSASPRVRRAAPALWRADARGFERRDGEEPMAEALRGAAATVGFPHAGVGVADTPVAADAAARLSAPGVHVVPPGGSGEFLAPLPVSLLPLSEEMQETLRALGIRRVGEVTIRRREEWEARFGPEGVRLHRWARGEDHRRFRATIPEDTPGASVDLDEGVEGMEPLLFLLRRLLDRLCGELTERGRCVGRLQIRLQLEGGPRGTGRGRGGEPGGSNASNESRREPLEQEAVVRPARPTRRRDVLFELCRMALERRVRAPDGAGSSGAATLGASDGAGRAGGVRPGGRPGPDRSPWRVTGLALVVDRAPPAQARQEDLFVRRWRDPAQAAAALSRLRARLGEKAAARPVPRAEHRPERRNRWMPVEGAGGEGVSRAGTAAGSEDPDAVVSSTLRLLPEPVEVDVRMESGRPVEVWDPEGGHSVVVAEGPERLSGDWWRDPYRREYYRVCTAEGELLWVFREYRRDGHLRWWLHGWWD